MLFGVSPSSPDEDPSCIYCSGRGFVPTKDHVPPKCLFPKPRPRLITVPACPTCNQSFKLDDEYFRLMLAGEHAYRDPVATKLWTERVMPHTGVGLRMSLLSQARPCNIRTPGGLYIGKAIQIGFDSSRIKRVVERIATGLLWHHYQQKVISEAIIETHFMPDLVPLLELLTSTNLANIGDTVFRYRYGRASDAPDTSIWGFQFYLRAHFIVTIREPRPNPPTSETAII
jgi:hypothetical protein